MKTCKFCGKKYSGPGVFPGSWGIVRKMSYNTTDDIDQKYPNLRIYCSEKCRREAEGDEAEGDQGSNEGGSSSGSSSSDSGSGGCLSNVLAGVVLVLLLAVVYGIFFGKKEDANDPAVKMAKWEEHLEKRRAAFAEGLPEEGVEARGLKNYTWEEWQALKEKGKEELDGKESHEAKSMADLWNEHQAKRRQLLRQGLSSDTVERMGYGAMTFKEFKARFGDDPEAKLKSLNARLAELGRGGKTGERQSPVTSAVAPKVPAPTPKVSVAPSPSKKTVAPVAASKPSSVPVPSPKSSAAPVASDAVGGQQNTGKKASKDSKAIRITVQGKGKTKEAAVRWALRDAVWKTVGTWVDSKSRIQENRDEVVAQVKTITEADVPKFEVIDTQEQNGGFVVKVSVSVSKKKIAPKFAKVFPDVFTIE